MHVSALYNYPVKSLGGHAVDALLPEERGFADDRRWMLVDGAGKFISQRSVPGLAKFAARTVGAEGLQILRQDDGQRVWEAERARPSRTPDVRVTVWDDTFDAIEVATPDGLGATLGVPGARLVYMNGSVRRPVDERYARHGETVSFADGYPYLFATVASLADLSERHGGTLDMLRFRPNIVIDGGAAYAEDHWKEVKVGEHEFYLPKPCARCIMITHAPSTGERDLAVLSELAAYRKRDGKVLFGMNGLWKGGTGELRVGDEVRLLA